MQIIWVAYILLWELELDASSSQNILLLQFDKTLPLDLLLIPQFQHCCSGMQLELQLVGVAQSQWKVWGQQDNPNEYMRYRKGL